MSQWILNICLPAVKHDYSSHLQSMTLATIRIRLTSIFHCVKTLQIRSFFWSVFSCIQSKYRKMRTRKNSIFGQFFSQWLLNTAAALTLIQIIVPIFHMLTFLISNIMSLICNRKCILLVSQMQIVRRLSIIFEGTKSCQDHSSSDHLSRDYSTLH